MPNPTTITPDQVERLVALMRATRTSLTELLEPIGVTKIAELSQGQYISAIAALQRKRSRLNKEPAEA
jgi:hypothetical protein